MIDLIKSPRQILMDETGLPQLDTGLLNNTQPNGAQGHATGGAISKNSEMLPHYGIGGTIAGMVEHFLPLAEREANKAKFLEPSKVKERMYHGTTSDISAFDPKTAANKTGNVTSHFGTFLSDNPAEASRYAQQWGTTGGNVMPVYAQLQNPYMMPYKEMNKYAMGAWNRRMAEPDYDPKSVVKVGDMDAQRKSAEAYEKHIPAAIQDVLNRKQELIELGHDGIIAEIGGNREIIPFKPTQIKSATGNQGTYNINNPDINHAEGGRIDNLSPSEMEAEMIYGGRTPPRFQYDKGGSVVKWAMNEVIPMMEHLKNKAAFTEPSAVKGTWYHGTPGIENTSDEARKELHANGITQFDPQRSKTGMMFASDKPKFANSFAEQNGADLNAVNAPKGTSPTVYPVLVHAKNPFDYANPQHVENLVNHLHSKGLIEQISPENPSMADINAALRRNAMYDVSKGYWDELEKPHVIQAVKDLGHDGMYVNENGFKNIGVFDPGQFKSAIGNRGTYDPADPNISRATGGPVHMADGRSTTLTGIDPQTLYSNYNDRMHAYMPQDALHARYAPKQPPPAPPSTLSKVGSFLLNHGLNMGVAGLDAYDAYKGIKENNPEKISEGLGGVATSFMPFPIQAAWELATHHPEASAQQTRDTSYGPLQELMNKKQQNDANNADLWYQSTHKYKPPTSIYALDPYHPSLDNTQ